MPWWKVLLGGVVLLVAVHFIREAIDRDGVNNIIDKAPSININR